MSIPRIRLHPHGPEVSRLVWGVWQVQQTEATRTAEGLAEMLRAAVDCGITTFDNADVYGGYRTEALFGAALKRSGLPRHAVEIVTKCGIATIAEAMPANRVKHYNTSAAYIRAAVDRSLANLATDYIDLLLIHRSDPMMDADETAAGLMGAIHAGKVRHVGVSNFTAAQVALLQSRLSVPLVTNQIQLSALATAPMFDGTLDHAQQHRMAPMAWSPLGKGTLFSSQAPEVARLRARLAEVGAAMGTDDIGAVALIWLMAYPARPVPILGTARQARLATYAAAAARPMDRQDWFAILEAARGVPVP